MRRSRAKVVVLGWVGLVALLSVPKSVEAQRSFGAHLEGGFGPSFVRPLEAERATGATASAGLSFPAVGAVRVALELAATAGGDAPGMAYIPESSRPGDRSLTTLLLGVEMAHRHRASGPFAFLGAGAGRSTLKNARGVFEAPYGDNWIIPQRSLTALSIGLGAGYRFGAGPGPLGFQFAVRTHALVDAGEIPASAYALTVGLSY